MVRVEGVSTGVGSGQGKIDFMYYHNEICWDIVILSLVDGVVR